jgi:hypothetical protein
MRSHRRQPFNAHARGDAPRWRWQANAGGPATAAASRVQPLAISLAAAQPQPLVPATVPGREWARLTAHAADASPGPHGHASEGPPPPALDGHHPSDDSLLLNCAASVLPSALDVIREVDPLVAHRLADLLAGVHQRLALLDAAGSFTASSATDNRARGRSPDRPQPEQQQYACPE